MRILFLWSRGFCPTSGEETWCDCRFVQSTNPPSRSKRGTGSRHGGIYIHTSQYSSEQFFLLPHLSHLVSTNPDTASRRDGKASSHSYSQQPRPQSTITLPMALQLTSLSSSSAPSLASGDWPQPQPRPARPNVQAARYEFDESDKPNESIGIVYAPARFSGSRVAAGPSMLVAHLDQIARPAPQTALFTSDLTLSPTQVNDRPCSSDIAPPPPLTSAIRQTESAHTIGH